MSTLRASENSVLHELPRRGSRVNALADEPTIRLNSGSKGSKTR